MIGLYTYTYVLSQDALANVGVKLLELDHHFIARKQQQALLKKG